MKRLPILLSAIGALLCASVTAQDSSSLTFSGYLGLYYNFDFANPNNHERPFFVYNHKRHNEVNVNIALVKASYKSARIRSNLAFMTGSYAQYNLSAEPGVFRHIYEANAGVKLSNNRNIWLDVGVMPSHLGFESVVSADNWVPSRSLVSESSPYYETGIKLTSKNQKETFTFSALLLNGWQNIQLPDGINRPSVGFQFKYSPNQALILNYSNFFGSDQPDSLNAFRTFHNLYVRYDPSDWGVITGIDIGTDKKIATGNYGLWYAPYIIIRKHLSDKSRMAFRTEYFNDNKQLLLTTNTPNGFNTLGVSANYDYSITNKALARAEWKTYFSEDRIFKSNNSSTNHALLLTLSLRL